jgi:ActR/RegA family two-component response regulator
MPMQQARRLRVRRMFRWPDFNISARPKRMPSIRRSLQQRGEHRR